MTLKEAQARHTELAEEIRRHDHAYYVLAQPSISDQQYDRLYRQLLDLEKEFPGLVTEDSPTQRVSERPLKEFKQALIVGNISTFMTCSPYPLRI